MATKDKRILGWRIKNPIRHAMWPAAVAGLLFAAILDISSRNVPLLMVFA
jgi:hypothetical protein